MSWIGVDLDGTLAVYEGWQGELHIGKPIPAMVDRVQLWLTQGTEVRIFTARVGVAGKATSEVREIVSAIQAWSLEHIGVPLPVTCMKDYGMVELWDDRAVRVITNTGKRCCG